MCQNEPTDTTKSPTVSQVWGLADFRPFDQHAVRLKAGCERASSRGSIGRASVGAMSPRARAPYLPSNSWTYLTAWSNRFAKELRAGFHKPFSERMPPGET